jgi:hypothetical protein
MTTPTPTRSLQVLPATANTAPALFEAWDQDIHDRARDLWGTIAARNSVRTAALLQREAGEEERVPSPATIRRWAAEESWGPTVDAALAHSRGKDLAQLQRTWLTLIRLSQDTLLDSMLGLLDAAPFAGASRIKSAEAVLRLAERSGYRMQGPDAVSVPPEDGKPLSLAERSRRMREAIVRENAAGGDDGF